jgi:hypothetical protein
MQDELNNEQQNIESSEESFESSDGAFVDGQKPKSNMGMLATLGAVAILGAGAFMYMKRGPQQAAADTIDQSASATINEFLHGTGGSAMMEQTIRDTEKVVQEFKEHSHKAQVPTGELITNPFRLKEPKPQTTDVAEVVPSRIREDEERQRISTEANALELQSILRGGRSACLLNNALYHEGDQIGSFTIDEIRPKSIIVHQGKYRFELTMKKS